MENMIRLGLCCQFIEEPVKFRTTTFRIVSALTKQAGKAKLAEICRHNAESLLEALRLCSASGIGAFRLPSQILPLKTHPSAGYNLKSLPGGKQTIGIFEKCRGYARSRDIRLSFHPDQFIVLNSTRQNVVENSIRELEYQAEVAEWVGADVINIHAGGGYGDKKESLSRLRQALSLLSSSARTRLTVENDDINFTPVDLLPLAGEEGIPLVYDVHHHRCHPDGLSVEEASMAAIRTWDREPLFHISSPKGGWASGVPRQHDDYIDVHDFPLCWQSLAVTVEVEAKAKELAVLKLRSDLQAAGIIAQPAEIRCAR